MHVNNVICLKLLYGNDEETANEVLRLVLENENHSSLSGKALYNINVAYCLIFFLYRSFCGTKSCHLEGCEIIQPEGGAKAFVCRFH